MLPILRCKALGLSLATLTALASSSAAGNVLAVGPGQAYATVQDAVNAAQNGDLVLVDPGTYPPFEIKSGVGPKQLTIAPSSGLYTIQAVAGIPEIRIEDVPIGRTVTVIGAQILFDDPNAPAVVVRNNRGTVRLHLLDVVESSFLNGASVSAAVEVENTRTFWLSDSQVWSVTPQVGDSTNLLCVGNLCNDGISGVQVTDTSGVIQNSRVSGYENSSSTTPTGCGGDGLRLIGDSSFWLLENTLSGGYHSIFRGGAGIYGGHAIHQVRTPADGSLNSSCGGSSSPGWSPGARLLVGQGKVGGFYGINNTNGSVGVGGGPVAFMVPGLCGDAYANESDILSAVIPLGGDMTVRMWTKKARQFALVVSPATRYDRQPGLVGRGMLGPNRALLGSAGITTAQTALAVDFPVPVVPSLIGLQVTVQAATGPVGGPFDGLTLPSFAVIGP